MTTTVTPSTKYQIVIPRQVRERLGIEPGKPVYINVVGDEARLSTKSVLERYAGTMKGVWGDDPVATIRRDRDNSDRRLEAS